MQQQWQMYESEILVSMKITKGAFVNILPKWGEYVNSHEHDNDLTKFLNF